LRLCHTSGPTNRNKSKFGGERRRERVDLVGPRHLGRADEEPIGEKRIVGLELGERDPGEDTSLEEPAVYRDRIRNPDRELV
jgi:hypothetical protein